MKIEYSFFKHTERTVFMTIEETIILLFHDVEPTKGGEMEIIMKEIYKKIISDVAMEISIMSEWRRKILKLNEKEVLEISFETALQLPDYIKEDIIKNKLTFFVKIVTNCPEEYDEGLIIFKFWAKEYPEICSYSGNNPNIL